MFILTFMRTLIASLSLLYIILFNNGLASLLHFYTNIYFFISHVKRAVHVTQCNFRCLHLQHYQSPYFELKIKAPVTSKLMKLLRLKLSPLKQKKMKTGRFQKRKIKM